MHPTDASAVLAALQVALQDESEVDVTLELRGLSRAAYDRLRGDEPDLYLNRAEEWYASRHLSDTLTLMLLTTEGPVPSRSFEVVR